MGDKAEGENRGEVESGEGWEGGGEEGGRQGCGAVGERKKKNKI